MSRLGKITILFISFLLVACQEGKEDLDSFITSVQSMQQAEIEPIPAMKTYETFLYSAAELRNPFVKTVVEVPVAEKIENVIDNGIYPDMDRLREELEAYELAELRLVGTLQQESLWALIQTPEGIIHRVQKGNYVGKNEGEIVMISDSDLLLSEIVPNNEGGGYLERESSLSLVGVD